MARKLKTSDPRIVSKYNQLLEGEFEKHNVYERALKLYNSFHQNFTNDNCAEYDDLDRIREKAMKKVEKKCSKLHMGAVPWTPEICLARKVIHYIKLVIRRKKHRKVSARTLIRLQKKIGFSYEKQSIENLLKHLDKAYKHYKQLKKKAVDLRKTHLEQLAEALEKDGKGKKAQILKDMQLREEQRAMFKKLRPLNKKHSDNLSLTTVTITQPDGSTVEVTDEAPMVQAIINENLKKYHQNEDTCPFLQPSLKRQFGNFGETSATERVLQGTFVAPSTNNDLTSLFLQQCHTCNTSTQLHRSVEQFKTSWKRMNEKTASHDLHFGHFKATCTHCHNLLVHYIRAEIPFQTRFAPSRWKRATNIMILKKAGLFNIEKLRTLCLFQSDHNHNNKFLGRGMMEHAMNHNHIASEQYSVPGKRSIFHALNKTLYFDNIRYSKYSACLTSCDLKSCYNRIAHVPAMLAARSYGIPKQPLVSFFATLQEVQYHTRTVYGVSDETFGGIHAVFSSNPQGAGQGNGAAPQLWALVSSKMFEMLHALGLQSVFSTPISGTEMHIVGFAYVDDSSLVTFSANHDVEATVQRMQKIVDTWEAAVKLQAAQLLQTNVGGILYSLLGIKTMSGSMQKITITP